MNGRGWTAIGAGGLTLLGLALAIAQAGLGALLWAPVLLAAGALAGLAGAWGILPALARRTAQRSLHDEQAALERLSAAERDERQAAWEEIAEARGAVQNAAQAVRAEREQAQAALAEAEAVRTKAERRLARERQRRENAVHASQRLRRKLKAQEP